MAPAVFAASNHGYLPLHYMREMEGWIEYIAVSLRLPGRPDVEFIRAYCRFTSVAVVLIATFSVAFYGYLYAQ